MTTNDPKPITLIVTIYPPKKNARRVVVSGAPEGEMPVIMDGLFPDRHALLDRVFALVLKRDPQVVTIADPKAAKPGKVKSVTAGADDEEEETEATDQLVTDDAVPVSPITEAENLPSIEGDDAPADADAVAKFEAQLVDNDSVTRDRNGSINGISNSEYSGEVEDGQQD